MSGGGPCQRGQGLSGRTYRFQVGEGRAEHRDKQANVTDVTDVTDVPDVTDNVNAFLCMYVRTYVGTYVCTWYVAVPMLCVVCFGVLARRDAIQYDATTAV